MKRKIKVLVASILLLSMTAVSYAQPYKGGVGLVVGNLYGVQGKLFLTPKLALQADLAWKLGTYPSNYHLHLSYYISDFELNPNLLYQSNIAEWGWGQLDWFVGGGLSFGCAFVSWDYNRYHYISGHYFGSAAAGKLGVNAIGGVELSLSKVPLAFAVDLRPGYGLVFRDWGISYFDWGVTASVRYCFGQTKGK